MARKRVHTGSKGPLSREAVLRAAIDLADAEGLGALTMRRLAAHLGVEAMTLYYHVANKADILSGMVDLVEREFTLPAMGAGDWKAELRRSAISTHDVLVRHRWAAALMLSTTAPLPGRMRYMDAILRTLREAGFSPDLTDLAYHTLESHVTGFTLWQVGMDLDPATLPDLAAAFLRDVSAGDYPYVVEHIEQHLRERPDGGPSTFEFGLDLVLDGLERRLAAEPPLPHRAR